MKHNGDKVLRAGPRNGYSRSVQLSVTDLSPAEQQSCLEEMLKYWNSPRMQAGVYNAVLWGAVEQVFLKDV